MKQNQSNQDHLHYGISLKLYFENKVFSPGVSTLPRGVEETGPLQGAVQGMNMTYGKAWKMLEESKKIRGLPLMEREAGGKDGGGSTLIIQAVRLLEVHDPFMKEAREELDRSFEKYSSQDRVEKPKNS